MDDLTISNQCKEMSEFTIDTLHKIQKELKISSILKIPLCLTLCDQWYLACMTDYVNPSISIAKSYPFCEPESLNCVSIYDTIDNSR
jgi:hypothetical protein